MQVLRVCSFSTFALPPALPPCYCPLAFRRQVRRLTSRISSESYPGAQEYVVSCHGAARYDSASYAPRWWWVVWGRVSASVVVAWPVHQVPSAAWWLHQV